MSLSTYSKKPETYLEDYLNCVNKTIEKELITNLLEQTCENIPERFKISREKTLSKNPSILTESLVFDYILVSEKNIGWNILQYYAILDALKRADKYMDMNDAHEILFRRGAFSKAREYIDSKNYEKIPMGYNIPEKDYNEVKKYLEELFLKEFLSN